MSMPPSDPGGTAPKNPLVAVAMLLVIVVAAGVVLFRSGVFSRQESQPPPSVAKPMKRAEIEALLRDWTYPGAKDTTSTLTLPTMLGTVANPWPKYVYRFAIAGSPATVRRFYAAKLGVEPNPGVASSSSGGVVPYYVTSYSDELQHTLVTGPARKAETGSFSHSTKDYMIEAVVSPGASPRQTQVILFLAPFQMPGV